jgi:hypothetical protein
VFGVSLAIPTGASSAIIHSNAVIDVIVRRCIILSSGSIPALWLRFPPGARGKEAEAARDK